MFVLGIFWLGDQMLYMLFDFCVRSWYYSFDCVFQEEILL